MAGPKQSVVGSKQMLVAFLYGQYFGCKTEDVMILDQGKLANGLVDELLALIHKYDESLYMCSVIGVLELVKQQLITESLHTEDDE
jgi:hypothetical protein